MSHRRQGLRQEKQTCQRPISYSLLPDYWLSSVPSPLVDNREGQRCVDVDIARVAMTLPVESSKASVGYLAHTGPESTLLCEPGPGQLLDRKREDLHGNYLALRCFTDNELARVAYSKEKK